MLNYQTNDNNLNTIAQKDMVAFFRTHNNSTLYIGCKQVNTGKETNITGKHSYVYNYKLI